MTEPTAVVLIVGCFGVGYFAFGYVIRKFNGDKREWARQSRQPQCGEGWREDTADAAPNPRKNWGSTEEYYREVLGVGSTSGEQEIKAAYRQLLAKYHPDKVSHLGDEFLDIAGRKTKEIIEAYDFLKRKYGFR